MDVSLAVEEALLPLRMKGLSLGSGGPDMVLQEVDGALSPVGSQNFSRNSLRAYIKQNVFLCLSDGTWWPSRRALQTYLRESGSIVDRELAKKFRFAKLLLVERQKVRLL